jgi:integrase
MNNLILNWKRIRRGLPLGREASNDRAPTIEEIQKLVEYPDRRIKAIIYTMVSSGIRLGAWDYLRWKHVTPMTNGFGEVIAAKLTIYPGDREEYYAFITSEAYNALKEWMDFRAEYGEKITGESWVVREHEMTYHG